MRSYRRNSRSIKKVKYSNETMQMIATPNASAINGGGFLCMIPATDVAGVRKVKNFDITFTYDTFTAPVMWALVYVPQGMSHVALTRPTQYSDQNTAPSSLYEPNQNVIMSGVLPVTANTKIVQRTRLARNLNSGDSIYLYIRSVMDDSFEGSASFMAQLNFAITF